MTDVGYAFLFGGAEAPEDAAARAALTKLLQQDPARVLTDLFEAPLRERSDTGRAPSIAATTNPLSLDDPEQFSSAVEAFLADA